jgi:hypothetical protein
LNIDQEYDSHQPRSAFDEPEDEAQSGTMRSPEELQGQYAPQFSQNQAPHYGEYYHGMPGEQQHMPAQPQYEHQQTVPATSNPGPSDYVDSNDHMLDADPFGLTASMHYPQPYSAHQYNNQR